MTPRWLLACIVTVVVTMAGMSVAWWASCSFWIGPMIWHEYVRSEGKRPTTEPEACKDSGSRAIATLSSLLATLLGLMSQPPSRD